MRCRWSLPIEAICASRSARWIQVFGRRRTTPSSRRRCAPLCAAFSRLRSPGQDDLEPRSADAKGHAMTTLASRLDNQRVVRAATGTTLSAKSWLTEAPLRMLMNNLDPGVAERPGELVVYGGLGPAARGWGSLAPVGVPPRRPEGDETPLASP